MTSRLTSDLYARHAWHWVMAKNCEVSSALSSAVAVKVSLILRVEMSRRSARADHAGLVRQGYATVSRLPRHGKWALIKAAGTPPSSLQIATTPNTGGTVAQGMA